MRFLLSVIFLICLPSLLIAQQKVKGRVVDTDSRSPLELVVVTVLNTDPPLWTIGDAEGRFVIDNVPLGRHDLALTLVGYEPQLVPNVEVTAGKEVMLELEMTESLTRLEEVVIEGSPAPGEVTNQLATLSVRSLNVDDASRYAASIADPARQAQNFAGVVGNGDDLNNDIVIRGNTPLGLLWRMEGLVIPNPNHFSSLGGTGGAISMLSSNVLANSDFYTAAFPAEFGNVTAGVFDLKLREGNNDNNETTIGAGFLGVEVASEGPIGKSSEASYLFNYRYSTLSILNNLGVEVAGDYLPNYQDLSFNVAVPTGKAGRFSLYGLGGNSWVNLSESEPAGGGTYVENTDDLSKTLMVGLGHEYFLSDKTLLKTSLNGSFVDASYKESSLFDQDLLESYEEESSNYTYRLSTTINHKFNARHTIQSGVIYGQIEQRLDDTYAWEDGNEVTNVDGSTSELQAFGQWKWRLNEQLVLNSGIHGLHYAYTGKTALEPRLGLKWFFKDNQSLSIGASLHSRAENILVYQMRSQMRNEEGNLVNRDLDLTRAYHTVLGYDWNLNPHTRLKIETYYQHLFDVPISAYPNANFSALNTVDVYDFFEADEPTLVNEGTGRNYGLELTLERFLNRGFYYMSTLSLYKSEFSLDGSNYFGTRFNGNYILNILGGKDFTLGPSGRNTFSLNGKATFSGGQRYTAADLDASAQEDDLILAATPFTEQIDNYMRFDIGMRYQWNLVKSTHAISFDVQNVTNRLNQARPELEFENGQPILETQTQTGLIPVLKYTLSF